MSAVTGMFLFACDILYYTLYCRQDKAFFLSGVWLHIISSVSNAVEQY